MLGRLRLALPREEAAIVSIHMDVLGIIDFGRGEASIDATLYDSMIAGFTLTGDMAMRASWRESPGFALSAGGFHPRFTPPAGFPALRRLALSLATGDNPRIRLETYLALTSNTAQLGARLELYAEAAGFSVEGLLYFDTLFQFQPFAFMADMGGSLALKRGDRVLMGISVELSLSGPTPWHARGSATFTILFFSVTISFDTTFGAEADTPLPEPVDVGALLDTAVGDPRNWAAQLPPEGESTLTLRELKAGERELLAHPLGTLSVTQRVAPLGVELERYGTAPLTDEHVFTITEFSVGGAQPARVALQEQFAPAQFHELSDHEKLSRPSFERQDAGCRLAGAAVDCDRASRTVTPLEYETAILDAPDAPARLQAPVTLSAEDVARLAATGPAARAATRDTGAARFAAAGTGPLVISVGLVT